MHKGGRRSRNCMVVVFITTYAIIVSLNPAQARSIQHYVIKFVSDFQQVGDFHLVLLSPPIELTTQYNWNIVESGAKHHRSP